jgi:hypothetical protein
METLYGLTTRTDQNFHALATSPRLTRTQQHSREQCSLRGPLLCIALSYEKMKKGYIQRLHSETTFLPEESFLQDPSSDSRSGKWKKSVYVHQRMVQLIYNKHPSRQLLAVRDPIRNWSAKQATTSQTCGTSNQGCELEAVSRNIPATRPSRTVIENRHGSIYCELKFVLVR